MTIRKRLKQHPKPKNSITRTLKSHTSIYIFFTVTVIIVSFSLIFSLSPIVMSDSPPALAEPQVMEPIQTSSQSIESKPQFNVEVLYAYVGKGPPEAPHSHFDGVLMYPKSQYPSIVYFNVTNISNSIAETCDAKIEVYLIQISSDKGSRETYTYFEATNYNPAFSNLDMVSPAISQINDLIAIDTTSAFRGYFNFNLTANQSILGHKVGSIGSYTNGRSGLGLWNNGEPNTITVSIRRLGWVTLNGSSILTTFATAEDIVQIQFEKFGDGFLYNSIISQQELSKMDLFHPDSPELKIQTQPLE